MSKITVTKIKKMTYVEFMAFLNEINRPPGGKDSLRRIALNCFINKNSKILDIGCNTGYCSFEIAHLVKCKVMGIDINTEMIKTARKNKKNDPLGHLIKFKVADATNLPFKINYFDVVISGGSTVFINNKKKTINEVQRVLKNWGFFADINFFYKNKPPLKIIKKINDLMGTNIEPWNFNYWLNFYEGYNLEKYYIFTDNIKTTNQQKIKNYCMKMVADKNYNTKIKKEIIKKLINIMFLFNENNKHLAYGIFILRKRPNKEQVSLFGA